MLRRESATSASGRTALESVARTASISRGLGIGAVIAMAAGPALAQIAVGTPLLAFRIFGAGLLLGLLALIFGVVGLVRTRPATGRSGRGNAVTGMLLGALPVAVVAVAVGSAGSVPAINDITTNPDDPPAFVAAGSLDANRDRDMSYPGAEFATAQRTAYADLVPLRVAGAPDAVFDRCIEAAENLGWTVTAQDRANGTFEAMDVSRLFRFVDDVVVRVRAGGDAAVVDVRSKSRDGKSDLGANAARIRAFRGALGS
jgi:uncharacterized protein (DUF1499 family)